jgi:hypothetical protein
MKKYAGIDYVSGDMALKGNIDILGKGSYISDLTVGDIDILGNTVLSNISFKSISIPGNITTTAGNFIGNGSLLTGIQATALPGNANINIRGNVFAPGNVDATNVSTTNLSVNGNAIVTGQINSIGNILGRYFIGNMFAPGNVDATNVSTTNLLVNGNTVVTGQVNIAGNVVGRYFLGNGALLSGVSSSLPGNASIDIRGNVFSSGNVDATNVSTLNLRVGGNTVVTGQVNITGNVVGSYFLGNGALLSGVTSSLPGNASIDIRGNVLSSGNVDATNVSTTTLLVNGNAIVARNMDVTGNTSSTYFIGSGAFLSGVTSSAFVAPVFSAKQYITYQPVSAPSSVQLTIAEVVDNYNRYNPVAGEFNPNIAGYYTVSAGIPSGGISGGAVFKLSINKNGVEQIPIGYEYSTVTAVSIYGSTILYMNGSSDKLTLSMYLSSVVTVYGTYAFSAYYVSQ